MKKKKPPVAAKQEDLEIGKAIARYFNALNDDTALKILSTPNAVAFYLHQNPWAQHLFSILTWKHGDSAFSVFSQVLVALGFAEEKPIK
ncbi:MAG: hypothetical protein ACD_74C00273G0006 [uncultured bacterium]|nr:MAG: hypothetical protein ACD_74C00273G0006 [uncultured bacterium]